MIDKSIYDRALAKRGKEAQLRMAQEECAELIVAISKYFRDTNGVTLYRLIEECVDVELMINQMKNIFKNEHVDWERWKKGKLERLEILLED